MTCEHKQFTCLSRVDRVTRTPEDTVPFKFIAEFSIQCAECGMMFAFDWSEVADPNVVPMMGEVHRPYTTFNRDTLCAPIKPAEGLAETYAHVVFPTHGQKPN